MSRAHYIKPTAPTEASVTVRLGAGALLANRWDQSEVGKAVKLVGESNYDLCAAGDEIEAFVTSVEMATANGWSIGGVTRNDLQFARADGLQATPGTGVITVGSYVVAGTATAKGTKLTDWPKVCMATTQATVRGGPNNWRVVSLGEAGTGAVGTTIVLQRQSAK